MAGVTYCAICLTPWTDGHGSMHPIVTTPAPPPPPQRIDTVEYGRHRYNDGREQAIRDCIAAVYNLEPETQFSGPYQMRRAAINALNALLEGEK